MFLAGDPALRHQFQAIILYPAYVVYMYVFRGYIRVFGSIQGFLGR